MPELLLGIDVGTSSTKGVLTSPDGRVVSLAVRRHGVSMPYPGWAEHDPVETWWEELRSVALELTAGAASGDIAAVGVSGIGPCLMPADADGKPLRPAILYGIDTRASAEIELLNERYGADAIRARCGSPLTSQSIGPKMLWLGRHEPGVWDRTRRWFMTNAYLTYRLTGEYVLDRNSASQAAPLYDTHAGGWASDWCEEIAPGTEWPRLLRPTEVAGTVSRDASAQTGLAEGTPVVIGSTDAWAEACSAGAIAPGDAMVMYGSSMALIEVLEGLPTQTEESSTVGVLPGVFDGQTNLVATLPTAGAVAEWLSEVAGVPHKTLVDEAVAAGPGAGGLIMLPYFAGLRTPEFDPFSRGAIVGLTARHTRGHLYRAALEATGFAIRHNLEAMQRLGGNGKRLVAVGGGMQAELAVQIASDITGKVQEVPQHTIGACHGDALLAGLGVGSVSEADASAWNPIEEVIAPQASGESPYEELYECYLQSHTALREQMHALASVQGRLGR